MLSLLIFVACSHCLKMLALQRHLQQQQQQKREDDFQLSKETRRKRQKEEKIKGESCSFVRKLG